jgi:S1-C subfamily serine protease
VIGIASFKVVGHAVEGIGFAVPIRTAARSLDITWR